MEVGQKMGCGQVHSGVTLEQRMLYKQMNIDECEKIQCGRGVQFIYVYCLVLHYFTFSRVFVGNLRWLRWTFPCPWTFLIPRAL